MADYRRDILDQLWQHGVQPTPATPPELVRGFVNELYRYEIRQLRDGLLRGEFPKPEYYGRVERLRNRYRVLALRADEWMTS